MVWERAGGRGRLAGLLGTLLTECRGGLDALLLQPDGKRPLHVVLELELGDGALPVRAAGVTDHDRKIVLLRSREAPCEEVSGVNRRAILRNAEEREVEVVSRKREVVLVAAEEGLALLGRAREAHVLVGLVRVQPLLAALIVLDRLDLEPGALVGILLQACDR